MPTRETSVCWYEDLDVGMAKLAHFDPHPGASFPFIVGPV
ncbi:hypothetical protein CGMCC3_g7038 [Colletotrichum fructicola]|nr:uncharacterized protein CGMCC3_g7038 [Colletotrichum fructicola]KAE9576849.1 hypothetical protein CGMCC3_g7038 [Colletotrichum fructicola]